MKQLHKKVSPKSVPCRPLIGYGVDRCVAGRDKGQTKRGNVTRLEQESVVRVWSAVSQC